MQRQLAASHAQLKELASRHMKSPPPVKAPPPEKSPPPVKPVKPVQPEKHILHGNTNIIT